MTTLHLNRDLSGDGRYKVTPRKATRDVLPVGVRPMDLTRAQARRVVNSFLAFGLSTHSNGGHVMWPVIEYCRLNRIAYTVVEHRDEDNRRVVLYTIHRG